MERGNRRQENSMIELDQLNSLIDTFTPELLNYAQHLAGMDFTVEQTKQGIPHEYMIALMRLDPTQAQDYLPLLAVIASDYQQYVQNADPRFGEVTHATFAEYSRNMSRAAGTNLRALMEHNMEAFFASMAGSYSEFANKVGKLKQQVQETHKKQFGKKTTFTTKSKFYTSQASVDHDGYYMSIDIKSANLSVISYYLLNGMSTTAMYDLIGLKLPHLRMSKKTRVKLASKEYGRQIETLIAYTVYEWAAEMQKLMDLDLVAILSDEVIIKVHSQDEVDLIQQHVIDEGVLQQSAHVFKMIKKPGTTGVILERYIDGGIEYDIKAAPRKEVPAIVDWLLETVIPRK